MAITLPLPQIPPAPLSHNDAIAITDALTRTWHENGVRFAGALETVIRRQAGHWDRSNGTPGPDNEARHLRLCGWVAAQIGLTAAARDRAGRHLSEMRAAPLARKVTEDDALVVGLDIVVNRALGSMSTLDLIAKMGQLMLAASAEAAATVKAEVGKKDPR